MKNNLYTIILISILGTASCGEFNPYEDIPGLTDLEVCTNMCMSTLDDSALTYHGNPTTGFSYPVEFNRSCYPGNLPEVYIIDPESDWNSFFGPRTEENLANNPGWGIIYTCVERYEIACRFECDYFLDNVHYY